MKSKKVISLLLAGLLTAGMMSGCGGQAGNDASGGADSKEDTPAETKEEDASAGEDAAGDDAETPADDAVADDDIPAPDPNERYEITYTGYWSDSTYEDGSYCETMLEDALDCDITVVKQEGNDALNVMLASGEMPDCATLSGKTSAWMYEQELVRTIPRNMVEKYCPSLIKNYDENPLLYAQTLNPENDQEFNYLTGVTFQFVGYYLNCDYYRYDWIQNLGIDLGVNVEQVSDRLYVADDGIELSKFIEIIDAFVNQDPDGNGENDTVGITGQNLTHGQYFSAYGFHSGVNEVDGKAEMYYVLPEYKEFLKGFAELNARGLVDPDIIQGNRQLMWDKVNSGNAGYYIVSTNALQSSWALDRPPLQLLERIPEATILATPGIKPDGGTVQSVVNASPAYENFFVRADIDDQKLAKILQFVELAWFGGGDKDFHASMIYGEKDVDWKWNDEGTAPVKINNLANGERGTWTFGQLGQDAEVTAWIADDPLFNAGNKYWTGPDGSWMKFQHPEYKLDIYNETDLATINAEVSGDINAYVGEYRTQVFLGQKDLDSTWDEYLAELERLGYSRLMGEYEKLDPLQDIIASYGN